MSIQSHPRPQRLAALGLVALMAAACSGGATANPTGTAAPPSDTTPATSQGATGTVDACSLVTTAEAGAAMGVSVATTKPKDDGGNQVCEYTSADGRTVLVVTLTVRVGDGVDKTTFDAAYAGQPVTGLGDDALFDADLPALAVLQNGTVLVVSLSGQGSATAAQIQAALTTVATAALGRL